MIAQGSPIPGSSGAAGPSTPHAMVSAALKTLRAEAEPQEGGVPPPNFASFISRECRFLIPKVGFRQRLGSLRVRLLLASGAALVGLAAVAGITVHQVFYNQAREHLRGRAGVLAQGAAAFLSIPDSGDGADRLTALIAWLKLDPDFESIRLLGDRGNVLFSFSNAAAQSSTPEIEPFSAAAQATRHQGPLEVQLALSPARLARDLENIRWLSAAMALLAGALFATLSAYLTREVVLPLEGMRRAAHRILNGEPNVRIPVSGDLELDEVAHFFQALAERRAGSASSSFLSAHDLSSEPAQVSRSAEG
jgi:HAMP domain-containing protein